MPMMRGLEIQALIDLEDPTLMSQTRNRKDVRMFQGDKVMQNMLNFAYTDLMRIPSQNIKKSCVKAEALGL